jgi:hypothetical protein
MNFKQFFKENNTPFFESLLMECVLDERVGDDSFRDKAIKITDFIIENIKIPKAHNFKQLKLIVDFQELPTYIKANFNSKFDTITINIFNDKEKFLSDIRNFLQDNKYALFHEVVHFIDYHRGSKFRADIQGVVPKVNTPMEFNAYFHTFTQMIEDATKEIMKSSDRNEAFEKYVGENVRSFIYNFWKFAKSICNDSETKIVSEIIGNIDWKYRWEKRLYQLYFELKEKLLNRENKQQLKNDIKHAEEVA